MFKFISHSVIIRDYKNTDVLHLVLFYEILGVAHCCSGDDELAIMQQG